MIRYLIMSCTAMAICMSGQGSGYANGLKANELNLKLTEISALQRNLDGRIALAMAKKDQLTQKTAELKQEVRDQLAQLKVGSYQQAVLNPRINYNLQLIQLLLGYVSRLDEKIVYFQNGHAILTFFFQQAQDDRLLIKTLNDFEIDKLIAQINEVLDEYIPATSKPFFDVNDVPMKSTKKIWQEIVKRN